tara:strand:- start:621 stop:1211 length:591 start_codon:yes stop_codon:yes gene_type:complete
MGLGLPTSGSGDFIPFIKYNAKAGRWYTKSDAGDVTEVATLCAVFDLENIRTGYIKFGAGAAPEHRFDTATGKGDAEQPDDKFKRGFIVNIFSDKNIGGLREFSSTAGVVNETMNALYDDYIEGLKANAGKLPVVECTEVVPIEGAHGTNYGPTLKISAWTDRPEAMVPGGNGTTAQKPSAPTDVPPPQQQAGDIF